MNNTTGGPEKVVLKGKYGRQTEYRAGAAITPGMLIKLDSAGTVSPHATAVGFAERLFAREDQLQGRTLDDAYGTGDLVFVYAALPGDEIYSFIKAGIAVAVGDPLVSNADGTLKAVTGSEKQIIGYCTQAIDNSGGGSKARCKIRVT